MHTHSMRHRHTHIAVYIRWRAACIVQLEYTWHDDEWNTVAVYLFRLATESILFYVFSILSWRTSLNSYGLCLNFVHIRFTFFLCFVVRFFCIFCFFISYFAPDFFSFALRRTLKFSKDIECKNENSSGRTSTTLQHLQLWKPKTTSARNPQV